MKFKSIPVLAAVFFTLTACSQKKEEIMSIQNPDITANNIVEKLANEVKHYPKEPVHNINYGNDDCFFEVLVNDIPVYKEFQYMAGSSFDANQAIFKSGTQKVTFRMYPAKYDNEDNAESAKIFSNLTYLELKLEVYDNTDKNYALSPIKKYTPPIIPNPVQGAYPDSIFIATGKEYYEGSFTFEAEVPYQLQNFEKAQDLRKMDKKELETKLLKKYKEVWTMYQNKDYDNIARISYDNLKNQFVAKYSDKKHMQDVWDMLIGTYKLNNFQMQPIENYELKFFAEGKLVAFMTKSQEFWARGNTALWAEFDRGEGEEVVFCNRYFYIPKGETDFKVY